MKSRFPILSLRTRITAVVVMILFAAGLLITYFNSVATEKMLTRDTGKSAELIADEFDFGVDTAGHVDSTILTVNARHALNLLHEVEFIGFY